MANANLNLSRLSVKTLTNARSFGSQTGPAKILTSSFFLTVPSYKDTINPDMVYTYLRYVSQVLAQFLMSSEAASQSSSIRPLIV